MLKKEVLINTYYVRKKPNGETNFGPSETVPDQAMSVREILSRFAKGQDIGGSRQPAYSEEDFTELEGLDKFQKMDLAKDIRQDIQRMQHEMQKPQTPQTPPESQQPESKTDSGTAVGGA